MRTAAWSAPGRRGSRGRGRRHGRGGRLPHRPPQACRRRAPRDSRSSPEAHRSALWSPGAAGPAPGKPLRNHAGLGRTVEVDHGSVRTGRQNGPGQVGVDHLPPAETNRSVRNAIERVGRGGGSPGGQVGDRDPSHHQPGLQRLGESVRTVDGTRQAPASNADQISMVEHPRRVRKRAARATGRGAG